MNAFKMLKKDHRAVDEMFQAFENETDAMAKADIAFHVCKDLDLHMSLEEEIFYPEAMHLLDNDMVDHAKEEHAEAKKVMAEILHMVTGPELDKKMSDLCNMIKHHVADEEDEMFPALEKANFDADHIGTRMEERKKELLKG